MATAIKPAITQPGPARDESSSREQRGVTTIPARVVAQIAAQAAYETGNVGSNAGGLLGIGTRRHFASRPEDLRAHVRSRVAHLTGLSVSKIGIEISWLNPSSHVRKSLK